MWDWDNNKYYYSFKMVQVIAGNYTKIYQGIGNITNPFNIAEYKADFDTALNRLGRGHWDGNILDGYDEVIREFGYFTRYRGYGKLQICIIADIYGATDRELERRGIWNPDKLKPMAYGYLVSVLNGGTLIHERKPSKSMV